MIAEFVEMLSRLQSLKQGQLWQDARGTVDEQCQRLLGLRAVEIADLSETELLARLIQGEPTQGVRDKVFFLTRLFKEAGDIAAAQGDPAQSRKFYLKGLHLLLYTLGQADYAELPEFVPRVDMFAAALADAPLPLPTYAGLMQHYERTGQFAKAEDALFGMLEAAPTEQGAVDFGIAFYERLLRQPDAALAEGNLPREELETGLAELRAKAKT